MLRMIHAFTRPQWLFLTIGAVFLPCFVTGPGDGTYGNVQLVRRIGGRALTNSLGCLHPEIREPADRLPGELGCLALAELGAPQLLFTNLAVASAMLNAFYGALTESIQYEEVYLDIRRNRVVPIARALAQARSADPTFAG